MVRALSPHCPNCAAALRFDETPVNVTCEYCEATLILDLGRITHNRRSATPAPASTPEPSAQGSRASGSAKPCTQPDPSLTVRESARFSMRVIEQPGGAPPADIYTSIELGEDRFAVVSLQCIDDDDQPLAIETAAAFEILKESLEDDGDPGLAVNLFLEEIARAPAFRKLRAAVCLIDPMRTTAVVYSAGVRGGIMWVSTEEGRPITAGTNHQALEKLDLAKAGSQFDNGRTIQMAALDLLVVPSFAFLYDPAMRTNGSGVLANVLREHFADEPERIVTLVKNAWWEARQKQSDSGAPLSGDLCIAAIGARLAEPTEESGPGALEELVIETHSTDRFDIAVQRREGDCVALRCVQDGKRFAFARARAGGDVPLTDDSFQTLFNAVCTVLGNDGHGNFDNPRAAGRAGLEAIGRDDLDLVVAHVSDEHRRVKYFAHGTKAAPTLGARGLRPDHEQQQFDSGGEVTLHENSRLLFPGRAPYEGEVLRASDLADVWYGGKASHLLEALRLLWRTRKAEKALIKICRAMAADAGTAAVDGLVLVHGK